jgi:hypothetical protein
MLFTIEQAFEVKEHYTSMLRGLPLVENPKVRICGLFIAHKERVDEVSLRLVEFDFDETKLLIQNDKESNYGVYAYSYDGLNIFYYELDAYLITKGFVSYYRNSSDSFY